jgi:hypothetical protein
LSRVLQRIASLVFPQIGCSRDFLHQKDRFE